MEEKLRITVEELLEYLDSSGLIIVNDEQLLHSLHSLDLEMDSLLYYDSREIPVIFVEFITDEFIDNICAVFPDLKYYSYGYVPFEKFENIVMSYMHVGQHGGFDLRLFLEKEKIRIVDDPEKYKNLEEELISIGYNLNILKEFNYDTRS